MELGVLGPLQVRTGDGDDVSLGGPKQRAVLALLVVHADEVVDVDLIVDELWPDEMPDAGRKTVQAYVSRLRRALGGPGGIDIIQPRTNGYVLATDGLTIDARRFEAAVQEARAESVSRPEHAAELLAASLATWRARPFADAYPTATLEREAARLDEIHADAIDLRAGALLAAGRNDEVVAEMRRATTDDPTRERRWELLMLALYRSGRQAKALQVYVDARQLLAEEYGIDPGPELAELQRRILQQDPSLEPDAGRGGARETSPEAGSALASAASRRPAGVVAILVAVVAAVVITATFLATITRPPAQRPITVGARYPVTPGAQDIAAADGRIWVVDPSEAVLTSIRPSDGHTETHELPAPPSSVASGLGYLWVPSEAEGSLMKVDPRTGAVVGAAEGLEIQDAHVAVGSDAVWVIREHARPFLRVDPRTVDVEVLPFVDTFGGPDQPAIAADTDRLWGANAYVGRIMSLDPETSAFDFAGDPRLGEHPARSILVDHDSVWYSQPTAGAVTRLDAASRDVIATLEIGGTSSPGFGRLVPGYGLSSGPGGVWAALPRDGRVVLIDDRTTRVAGEVRLDRPIALASDGDSVWALDERTDEIVQLHTDVCDPLPPIGPGADLRGCDLSGKALLGVDLSGADLRWADLRLTAMQSVDLTDADLLGARLAGAALDEARWQRTRCPDGSYGALERPCGRAY